MKPVGSAAALLLALAQAGAAGTVSYTRAGNRFELRSGVAAAELEWLTPGSFRFRRSFDGALAGLPPVERLTVPIKLEETSGGLSFATRYIRVGIRDGLQVTVRKLDGAVVFADLAEPAYRGGVITLERALPPGAGLYGLGPRTTAPLNARGSVVQASVPFLFSTAGYAEYHAARGAYVFDMAHPDRYRVEGRSRGLLDYVFAYGPTPKGAFEELHTSGTSIPCPPPGRPEAGWAGLRKALTALLNASWTGLLEPALDETTFYSAPAELRERALQLAALLKPGARKDLAAYALVYRQETCERGIPPIRPLSMQFPNDAEAARHSDVFLFGDELLAAPLLAPGNRREVYLPMGTWTRLDTNETFAGRRTVTIQSDRLALFSRNGMIVPLQSAIMELHYFPKLAAEFFLYEEESGQYSQVHAAPAADILRLEIESVVDREYEWVVHHTPKPREVDSAEGLFTEAAGPTLTHARWYYEAPLRNLRIRVRAAAGEDRVVNVAF